MAIREYTTLLSLLSPTLTTALGTERTVSTAGMAMQILQLVLPIRVAGTINLCNTLCYKRCQCLSTSTVATLGSNTGIPFQSSRTATNSPVNVNWEASGNGPARHLRRMTGSRLWTSTQDIQVEFHFIWAPGLIPSSCSLLIPTADFFDGKHHIVLGGSWATHPQIAGRTTL